MVQIIEAPHYVRQPGFIFWIRVAILVLTVLVLALTAFSMSTFSFTADAFAFNIFCCVYNFIVTAYLIVSVARFIQLWNCWAALVLDVVGVIFWLAAWSTMASWSAATKIVNSVGDFGSIFGSLSGIIRRATSTKSRYSSSGSSSSSSFMSNYENTYAKQKRAWQAGAAASGLGALIWWAPWTLPCGRGRATSILTV